MGKAAVGAAINPVDAVAEVVRMRLREDEVPLVSSGRLQYFLGTCFALRSPRYFLTARHCIGDLQAPEVGIRKALRASGTVEARPVRVVHRHPRADVAILELHDDGFEGAAVFSSIVSNYGLGEDFIAYGFPEDIFGVDSRRPVPRVFKGHFQRFLPYTSHLGFQYDAGELSIPCPAGLSGGPLFRRNAMSVVTGLVTENLESTTVLHAIEEIAVDGATIREKYQRVINYGIALMLDRVLDWINSVIPTATMHR